MASTDVEGPPASIDATPRWIAAAEESQTVPEGSCAGLAWARRSHERLAEVELRAVSAVSPGPASATPLVASSGHTTYR